MADAILVIGGYGAVGEVVASTLARRYADRLIIAGRSETRASALASTLGAGVRWRVVDMNAPVDYDKVLADVGYVLMCLDVPDVTFVKQCLQRGIHYVDISAEYPILAAIERFDSLARQHHATAVLSVGLVPGLSNLLARHSLQFIQPIERFDIAIVAGMGEKHGVAGSTWILNHMGDEKGTARFQLREPFHQKTVYRFAFSDQYTLPQTLPIAQAATWLGFDSSLMTRLIGLARLPLLGRWFKWKPIKQLLLNSTQKIHFGTDEFVLSTRAYGSRTGGTGSATYQTWLRGRREALVTGLVAAEVIHRLISGQHPSGVYHIEQLFELQDFLPMLETNGVTLSSACP